MVPCIIQRASSQPRIEHRADMGQREIPWHPGDEHVELLFLRARYRKKASHFELPDLDPHAYGREVVLDQLFHRVVGTANGEELDGELAAAPGTPSLAARESPPGIAQKRCCQRRIVHGLVVGSKRVVRRYSTSRGVRKPRVCGAHDSVTAYCNVECLSHAQVIERFPGGVEYQGGSEQHRVRYELESRVPPYELRHSRRDSRHVQVSTHESGKFRGCLVHHGHHETLN